MANEANGRSVAEITEEYEATISAQMEIIADLKTENQQLKAEAIELKNKEKAISDALVAAQEKGKEIEESVKATAREEIKRLQLFAHKCRLICEKILSKYEDKEDVKHFKGFTDKLNELFGMKDFASVQSASLSAGRKQLAALDGSTDKIKGDEGSGDESNGFKMEDVLMPKKDLNLDDLCKELGIKDDE